MGAPLYERLSALAEKAALRMHMPGHKGKLSAAPELAGAAALDFTELADTGSLYEGTGPIAEAEALAAKAFGAGNALFLTGGATQGIQSAVFYAARRGRGILMDRGSHLSAYNACGLLRLDQRYLYPEAVPGFGCLGPVTPEMVREGLAESPAAAVLITSPTYYGVLSDVPAIAQLCREKDALLVVDAAHGAHLPFMKGFETVLKGADIAIVSAHKTLPALGQSALMLTGPGVDARQLRGISAIFGSSSPSYALMASMDAARAYMERGGAAEYERAAAAVRAIRGAVNARGVFRAFDGPGLDPLRLVVNTDAGGLSGLDSSRLLSGRFGIAAEMADLVNVVFIITGQDGPRELEKLSDALLALEGMAGGTALAELPAPPGAQARLTPGEAMLAPRELVPLNQAAGRVAGEHISVYPPGIPLLAAGEMIEQKHLAYLEKMSYNMNRPIETLKD